MHENGRGLETVPAGVEERNANGPIKHTGEPYTWERRSHPEGNTGNGFANCSPGPLIRNTDSRLPDNFAKTRGISESLQWVRRWCALEFDPGENSRTVT